jgi:hypothetical protein
LLLDSFVSFFLDYFFLSELHVSSRILNKKTLGLFLKQIVDFPFPRLFRSLSAVGLFLISGLRVLGTRLSRVPIISFCWAANHSAGELLDAVQ